MSSLIPDELRKWVQPHLQGITTYIVNKLPDQILKELGIAREEIIEMSGNENPLGCSPKVNQALADCVTYNRYPDNSQMELREIIARYAGTTPDRIVATGGSDPLLDNIARLFLGPGDEVINCAPTFPMYEFVANLCGAKVIEVPRDKDFNISVKGIKAAITENTKLIFLCNPNNPTGNITRQEDLLAVAEAGVPLVVDEAYYEFCGETVAPFIDKYPNIMVVRTLSKWAGLAGVRIGYGIFTPCIAGYLMATKIPFCVSTPATIALKVSLQDKDYLMDNVRQLSIERERLFKRLAQMDFLRPYPSAGNFVLCTVLKGNASEIAEKLKRRGILIVHYNTSVLKNGIRISVGTQAQNEKLVEALIEIKNK